MGETGSVSFMFDRVGSIEYGADAADAEAVFDAAIEAGADDVISGEDSHEIICTMEDLHGVVDVLAGVLGEPQAASIVWKPQNDVPVDAEAAEKFGIWMRWTTLTMCKMFTQILILPMR